MKKDKIIRSLLTILLAIALIGSVNTLVPEYITINEQRRREKISENNARYWKGKKKGHGEGLEGVRVGLSTFRFLTEILHHRDRV